METKKKITTRKYEVTGPEIVGVAYEVRKIDSALQSLAAFGKGVKNSVHPQNLWVADGAKES